MMDVYEFHSYFGRRLRTIRKARDYSVKQMIEQINAADPSELLSASYYQRVEQGTAKPSVHLTYLLADVLKCSIYDFIPPQLGVPIPDDFHTNHKLAEKLKAIEDIIRA